MPIYEYETIPQNPTELPERFEIRQRMDDAALSQHPESGVPIRRVFAAFSVGAASTGQRSVPALSGGCCCNPGGSCGLN